MAKNEIELPRPRTATLNADELEEIAAALPFVKVKDADYFISPETGRPVKKTEARQHAATHYQDAASAIDAGRLPEQKARRDYILEQHVESEEEGAPASSSSTSTSRKKGGR